MSSIKEMADGVIDTSFLKPRDLEPKIKAILKVQGCSREINIHLQSFGFKYGLPIDVDLVLMYVFTQSLLSGRIESKNGNDPEVVHYIKSFPISEEFYKNYMISSLFNSTVYCRRKKHLSIGIGCSGGKHRSVAFVNTLYEDLKRNKWRVYKSHREQEFGNW